MREIKWEKREDDWFVGDEASHVANAQANASHEDERVKQAYQSILFSETWQEVEFKLIGIIWTILVSNALALLQEHRGIKNFYNFPRLIITYSEWENSFSC